MKRLACAMCFVASLAVTVAEPTRAGGVEPADRSLSELGAEILQPGTLVVEAVDGRDSEVAASLAGAGWAVVRHTAGTVEVAATDEADGSAGRLAAQWGVASVGPPQPAVESRTGKRSMIRE